MVTCMSVGLVPATHRLKMLLANPDADFVNFPAHAAHDVSEQRQTAGQPEPRGPERAWGWEGGGRGFTAEGAADVGGGLAARDGIPQPDPLLRLRVGVVKRAALHGQPVPNRRWLDVGVAAEETGVVAAVEVGVVELREGVVGVVHRVVREEVRPALRARAVGASGWQRRGQGGSGTDGVDGGAVDLAAVGVADPAQRRDQVGVLGRRDASAVARRRRDARRRGRRQQRRRPKGQHAEGSGVSRGERAVAGTRAVLHQPRRRRSSPRPRPSRHCRSCATRQHKPPRRRPWH